MGNGVLGQKRCLQANFRADPFAFVVRSVGGVITTSPTAELRAKVGALDLVVLPYFPPRFIAHRARDVYFESNDGHLQNLFTTGEPRGLQGSQDYDFLRAPSDLCGKGSTLRTNDRA